MRTGINQQEKLFAKRRAHVLKGIRGEAAIFPSAPIAHLSRDQSYPLRQDSDLLYLTGIAEPETVLVLAGGNKGARSILFMRERDPAQEVWHGERLGLRRAKRNFNVDEVRNIDNLEKDLKSLLTGVEVLHYALGANSRTDNFVIDLLRSRVGPRPGVPNTLKDSRLMISEMRFVKDKEEISYLKHAVDITAEALVLVAPQLKTAKSENHAAKLIESAFARLGAPDLAFHTIVASGKNATELHHMPTLHPLWKSEPVLIDCGASYRNYAGDITRVFPVSGRITGAAREIYQIVHAALEQAKKKAKPDSSLSEIHHGALNELVSGLVKLKIVKGTVSSVISNESYKPFFMHRTSHWLGIDVHDTSPLFEKKPGVRESAWEKPLVPGNALTLEPGLYFHPADDRVPKAFRGIGVRIEDSVLITAEGCNILSARIPSKLEDVEQLVA